MKKLLFICLLSIAAQANLFAQKVPEFNKVPLKKVKDYKSADSVVLQTSNYLLTTPIEKGDSTRLKSAAFLMKWMDGIPDYPFTLEDNATRYFVKDLDLMAVYMAALCKAALQNQPGVDSKTITLTAVKILLVYANNNSNNVQWTKDLKELSAANDKGDLESFLEP